MPERQYLCIDQKSFYATVECVARGLDPMTTNLVVADPTRSENTICLAVSPSLKALGVKNRCRIKDIPSYITHIVAQPRMLGIVAVVGAEGQGGQGQAQEAEPLCLPALVPAVQIQAGGDDGG